MFRASANGNNQYNQMAVRQNGTYEIASVPRSGGWSVPVSGEWENSLVLNRTIYTKGTCCWK